MTERGPGSGHGVRRERAWRARVAISALVGLGVGACAPVPPVPAPPPPSPASPPPVEVAPAEPTAPVESPPPAPAPPAAPAAPFPPPAFRAPHERTARPGDGVWTALVANPAAGAEAASVLYRSTIRPHPIQSQIYVALVAIDLQRVDVRLVAGTKEPLSDTVPAERRPGIVPAADLPALVAVMNGGFMTRHGQWGMAVGADVLLPPKDDGCTVALLRDGSVRIRTHASLGVAAGDLAAFRQTPPCLVEQGKVQPALLGSEKPRRWGMSETGGLEIRRSALGILPGGRTLVYGLGEGITPRHLAEAMHAVGAVDAAELDVNWSYTRFLLYGKAKGGGPPEVVATLVPKIKHGARQYVEKPAERDFFYLARKPAP